MKVERATISRLLIAFFAHLCCFSQSGLSQSAPAFDLGAALRADSLEIDRLWRKHALLMPDKLKDQMPVLDSIHSDLFTDTSAYSRGFIRNNEVEYQRIKRIFEQQVAEVAQASERLRVLERAFADFREQCRQTPVATKSDYRKWRSRRLSPARKSYLRALNKVRWKENWITARLFVYFHHAETRRYPMATKMMSEYIDNTAKMAIQALREDSIGLAKDMMALKLQIQSEKSRFDTIKSELEIARAHLHQTKKITEAEKAEKQRQMDSISVQLRRAWGEFGAAEAKMSTLKRDMRRLQALAAQRETTEKRRLDSLGQTIASFREEAGQLRGEVDSLNKGKADLRSRIELEAREKQLERSKNAQLRWFLVVSGLGLISLIVALALWRKGAKRLARAYKRLSSSRKNLQEAKAQLAEKAAYQQVLLREIHHRTKNNLQLVGALLREQARNTQNPESSQALLNTQARVGALGLIHKQLYKGEPERFSTLNIADYVRNLAEQLIKANDYKEESVRLDLSLQNLAVEIELATEIGLIINELLLNAFKHALPQAEHPALGIRLGLESGILQLAVRDNGPGFAASENPETAESFGMELIRLLVKAREGSFRCTSGGGAFFEVELPVRPKECRPL